MKSTERTRKFRLEHPGYYTALYAVKKADAIRRLGGKCVSCGSTEKLEFDHIDPAQKKFNITSNLNRLASNEELAKCQLLCNECHKLKSRLPALGVLRAL